MFSSLRATDVIAAADRIRPLIKRTPLIRSAALSDAAGGDVYLKLENQQTTGSFKLRGALNVLATLPPDVRARGVDRVVGGQPRTRRRVRGEAFRRAGDDLRAEHRAAGKARRNHGARRNDRHDAAALRRRDGRGKGARGGAWGDVHQSVPRRHAARRSGHRGARDPRRSSRPRDARRQRRRRRIARRVRDDRARGRAGACGSSARRV